ncbi:hypothetical protein BROUX41_004430 [Berkeleyomyces rouxiae]|uniref:uncharacterized protein n=1 Tax=Berkeleyomyces rouxiae TaxID=2035830 RepID=UPI003B773140
MPPIPTASKRKHTASPPQPTKKPKLQAPSTADEHAAAGAPAHPASASSAEAAHAPPQRATALTSSSNSNSNSSNANTLSTPLPTAAHEPLLATLCKKYTVLQLSVISSSQLRTRITRALQHLSTSPAGKDSQAALVFLHARPGDVGKMISIAEKVKSLLAAEGTAWVQYNRLFESAARATGKNKRNGARGHSQGGAREMVAVPAVDDDAQAAQQSTAQGDQNADDESDDDYFESTANRFERAANPPKAQRPTMSLSIYLSVVSIPELRSSPGISMQTSEDTVE